LFLPNLFLFLFFTNKKKMSASTPKTFNSQIRIMGEFKSDWTQDEIKAEPMFFNCDTSFAYKHGGNIMKAFIEALPNEWENDTVIDSRIHMLMPGWYPAIPGWHHDDVPRPAIPTGQHFITAGQPDYDNPRYHAEHIMALINAEVCPTKFAIGKCEMTAIPEGELIYRTWHKEVERLIDAGYVKKISAPSGKLIYFDCDTFHTGDKAVAGGWRWFVRVSRNTDRVKNITNEIRQQVQVYLEFPMEGW
jgi:hypothetical protein